ncbi:hypothetical protein [Pseudozobellia thermophila]|uniref:Viral A-type inclusion protein n=1 Tax=Pseudozobellia thermophila TaxID=192903 RepID=A0A1M6AN00_9FLAO|nr:hypothetical protein [Pseudozobellia thermophila]SHI37573.1 hypothetical protein SAMN04488513_101110 [Pseudozobellia thermophila]
MKKLFLFAAIAFLCLSSCNEQKEPTQMQNVMAIHDEVMPQMGKLGDLVGELNAKENDSTELGKKYMKAKKDLQAAHKSMMDWMQNFGNRFDPDEILNGKELSEQKQQWLDEEEEKVKELKREITESIANAEALLEGDE